MPQARFYTKKQIPKSIDKFNLRAIYVYIKKEQRND